MLGQNRPHLLLEEIRALLAAANARHNENEQASRDGNRPDARQRGHRHGIGHSRIGVRGVAYRETVTEEWCRNFWREYYLSIRTFGIGSKTRSVNPVVLIRGLAEGAKRT